MSTEEKIIGLTLLVEKIYTQLQFRTFVIMTVNKKKLYLKLFKNNVLGKTNLAIKVITERRKNGNQRYSRFKKKSC